MKNLKEHQRFFILAVLWSTIAVCGVAAKQSGWLTAMQVSMVAFDLATGISERKKFLKNQ